MEELQRSDFLIVGAGIIGLAITKALQKKFPKAKIIVIEKESKLGEHASGRNSGVLHAGFYYTKDSLKAKFTKEGNRKLKEFCKKYNLKLNENQKVVVAKNKDELDTLYELEERGKINGVEVELINLDKLSQIEPNAKSYKAALFSPTTATVDPKEILEALKFEIIQNKGKILFNRKYLYHKDNIVYTNKEKFKADIVINSAGLYADKIAKDYNIAKEYTIIPFKGVYLKEEKKSSFIKKNIYPVPNLKNPFLGVHFTITVDNQIKIGPTAIPAFWRENYKGFENFNLNDLIEIIFFETKLFITNAFNFRDLAFEEFKKYSKRYLALQAKELVKDMDITNFKQWSNPGIRAQLLNKNTLELVQDFVVKKAKNSIHILNAVSPAFTCSIPFGEWIVENYI